MLRFAGFVLDQRRAELRGPDGDPIRLRSKPFAMLNLLAANAGRVVEKEELMQAIWPNVHVGEDSLFQCIREIRAALGDEDRQLLRVISGRGYLFDVAVADESTPPHDHDQGENGAVVPTLEATPVEPASGRALPSAPKLARRLALLASAAGFCVSVGIAAGFAVLGPDVIFQRQPPAIAVMPLTTPHGDTAAAAMATGVTDRLTDGFARIENLRVVTSRPEITSGSAAVAGPTVRADFILQGELERTGESWRLQTRLIRTATGEVQAVAERSVDLGRAGGQMQQTRLAAGAGAQLARNLNALLEAERSAARSDSVRAARAKVVVEQANASINQTSRERFAAAQTMLETALAESPENVDLQVALAALKTRAIQMLWYEGDAATAEREARELLENAIEASPRYIPVLESYCRFLTATNQFVESLVACARVLSFDPWNGSALYQLGLTQIHLGRFKDALASFEQADRYDTPDVSRWTWLLGIGWAKLLLEQDEEAITWLERSIAITPASGRTYFLLAIAHHRLGRTDEARAALAKGMELRPDSTTRNIAPPSLNISPLFLETGRRYNDILVELGLPEG